MGISIKDEHASELARQLAAEADESITTAVSVAVRERLERLRARKGRRAAVQRVLQAAWNLQRGDQRTPEEVIGYDEHGLPT